jgi:hypothetical protein
MIDRVALIEQAMRMQRVRHPLHSIERSIVLR